MLMIKNVCWWCVRIYPPATVTTFHVFFFFLFSPFRALLINYQTELNLRREFFRYYFSLSQHKCKRVIRPTLYPLLGLLAADNISCFEFDILNCSQFLYMNHHRISHNFTCTRKLNWPILFLLRI